MAKLNINSLTLESANSDFNAQQVNSFIANVTELKATVNFFSYNKIKSIVVKITGANSLTGAFSSVSYLSPGKTNNAIINLGKLKNAGDNAATVTITDIYGETVQHTIGFKSYKEQDQYITVQDSYIDNSVARGLIDGKYYLNHSRLGLRIKTKSSQEIKSLSVTIGSETYKLDSYSNCWNDFSFTCPDVLNTAGDCKVIITGETKNGSKDTKNMTIHVHSNVSVPPVPTIKFEHRNPRRHRHFFFCEGERLYFTGTSPDIEDYQIIVAYAECDTFKAFEKYDSDNCYADVDSDELSDKLEENISDDIRYYIYKDFDEGEYARPICRYPHHKHGFRLYYIAPEHDAHEEFFALQWFEHAEPGDAIFVYVRERKRINSITETTPEYVYSDNYEYNEIPKSEMFPMCVLPPGPSELQLYEQSRTDKKITIEYLNPIYDLDLGRKNPIHLVDVCLIAKDKDGKVLNGSETKKRDGRWGRSWVYYSDRQWHNIVPWKYSKDNNREKFTMDFDISKYDKDATIYIVAFYYPDFYRHPCIYSTSNILQSKSRDMDFDLMFEKPENNSTVNSPNPLIYLKMIPKIEEEDAVETSIYSDINFCKRHHWHKHRHHWHKCPIWLHHWPRPHDHCFPFFREHEWYRHNDHNHIFHDCPHHRIEHHHHHKHCYYKHHKCWKIPEKTPTEEPAKYNECGLFLSCGNKEISLGDINIDELDTSEKIFSWVQDSNDTFLSPGVNTISAYTYPYIYTEEENKNEFEIFEGHWHTRCHFICHPVMPHHPNHYLHCIVRPNHIHDWLDIERDIIKFKIPYRRLKPNHEYEFTFKSFVDYGFWYDPNKIFEVEQSDEDNDLICGAFLDMIVHHDSILRNVHYDKRHIIYRPCYHIRHHNHHRPCINNYKKEVTHTIKFIAPKKPNDFPWDRFFDIVLKVRGANKVRIYCCKLKDVTGKTEEDVMASKELDRSIKQHKTSINVTYNVMMPSTPSAPIPIPPMKELYYINPMISNEQMALRNYLLNVSSECGITTVKPGWRNYNSNSYLMARDYNDIKDYCYNLYSAIKNKYTKTFIGNPELFKILPTIVAGDRRGPTTYSNRGQHYFPEWDDLIDTIKKQIFQEYIEPEPEPEPIFIPCTGINIIPDRIPIPQHGKIGDQYRVDYEVFPSNCMEEVIWLIESTQYLNVNDAIMKRTVDTIPLETTTTTTTINKTKNINILQGYYDNETGEHKYHNNVLTTEKFNLYELYKALEVVTITFRYKEPNGRVFPINANDMCFYKTESSPVGSYAQSDYWIGQAAELIEEPNGIVSVTFRKSYQNDNLLSKFPYMSWTIYGDMDEPLTPDKVYPISISYKETVTDSTTKEKVTKVIAKCGSYSDSAIVYVEPEEVNELYIKSFTINGSNLIDKTCTVEKSECNNIVAKIYSTLNISNVTLKISGNNSRTVELKYDSMKNNLYTYKGSVTLSKAGTDTFTVKAININSDETEAKGTVKTKATQSSGGGVYFVCNGSLSGSRFSCTCTASSSVGQGEVHVNVTVQDDSNGVVIGTYSVSMNLSGTNGAGYNTFSGSTSLSLTSGKKYRINYLGTCNGGGQSGGTIYV